MIRRTAAIISLACTLSAFSQKKPTPVVGTVELAAQPDLIRHEVAAFPRIIAGPGVSDAVAKRINAALGRHDESARADAIDCEHSSSYTQGTPDLKAWKRIIDVTMRGPRFIAFLVTDSFFCGAYPNLGIHTSLVYDLNDGLPVKWLKFLPSDAREYTDTGADGSIEWPALLAVSRKQATAECKEVFDEMNHVQYSLTLNARTATLDAQPNSFPHVVQACAETVTLNTAALRKLGASPDLTNALDEAHALQKDRLAGK